MADIRDRDVNGRRYVLFSSLQEGQIVELDSGFDCVPQGQVVLKKDDKGRIGFECSAGFHCMDGQVNDARYCIGVYEVNQT